MHLLQLLLLLLFSIVVIVSTTDEIDSTRPLREWCMETPHPDSCIRDVISISTTSINITRETFYQMSLEAALSRAVRARKRLRHIEHRFQTHPDVHVFSDCEELYANTIFQINRTLLSTTKTYYDVQTWLSAGLTNLNMCNKNFESLDQPLGDALSALKVYDVSELISNCLAINRPMVADNGGFTIHGDHGFPSYTTRNERRLLQSPVLKADLVVAKDGTGNYKTVREALKVAARMGRRGRIVILVKAGIYEENAEVVSSLKEVMIVGEGKTKTIITNSKSVAKGYTLITSATLGVFGDGFIARDLTIRNTNGPGSQAVALLLASDRSVVYRCSIEGYQDTLFVFSQRQFFRESDIHGTIDFIFGNAAVVIQKCNIIVRNPLKGEANVITAQGRTDPNQNTGIVIQFSNITPSPELLMVHRQVQTFLGRPWMEYSRTILLQNYMSSIVSPLGWMPWRGEFALRTLYYAEFKNTGPGSMMRMRVRWPGFHVVTKPSLVKKFTVNEFIAGGMWIPLSGAMFSGKLS